MQLIYSLLPALVTAAAVDKRDPFLIDSQNCGFGFVSIGGGPCQPAGGPLAAKQEEKRSHPVTVCPPGTVRHGLYACAPITRRDATAEDLRAPTTEQLDAWRCPPGQMRNADFQCVSIGVATRDTPQDYAQDFATHYGLDVPTEEEVYANGCPPGQMQGSAGRCTTIPVATRDVPAPTEDDAASVEKRNHDICGLDMVWDGTRCRVPVGKRQLMCPPGLMRWNGACVTPGVVTATHSAEKRSACGSNAAFVEGQGCVARSPKQNKRRSQ